MRLAETLGNEKGATLTELLASIALTVILAGILAFFFKEGISVYDRTVAEADAQLMLRHRLEILKRDIRSSVSGEAAGIRYPFADDANRELVLCMGTADQPSFVSYHWEDGVLYRSADGEAREPFLDRVEDFRASASPDGRLVFVKIAVVVQAGYQPGPEAKTVSVIAHPRGKVAEGGGT